MKNAIKILFFIINHIEIILLKFNDPLADNAINVQEINKEMIYLKRILSLKRDLGIELRVMKIEIRSGLKQWPFGYSNFNLFEKFIFEQFSYFKKYFSYTFYHNPVTDSNNFVYINKQNNSINSIDLFLKPFCSIKFFKVHILFGFNFFLTQNLRI